MDGSQCPNAEQFNLVAVLCALGDPARMRIVQKLLNQGEISCRSICATTPKSTLSHHLRILRNAGITVTRIEGTQRFTAVRIEELESRFPGLLNLIRADAGDLERNLTYR